MTSIGYHPETGAALPAAAHRALPPPFDSPEGEAAYLAAYDANTRFWPVPFEPLDIATRFGRTHLVASGPAERRQICQCSRDLVTRARISSRATHAAARSARSDPLAPRAARGRRRGAGALPP